ncbi:hypothetical protein FDP41_002154 [Naegleria fowleri]|uniref:Uncharacterized protein n=1 Tax=Naegleria fowleri TaxID=5763 RepID=A0A6A5BXN4_NAEFO|nr:uncharacterized protein FDP41_002154 [Naegleria fowleri]KAF0979084.1 hypothetical protein FDP41_002154 [Naegleria fowleri]
MKLFSEAIAEVLRRGKQPNIARQPKKLMGHYSKRHGGFIFEKEKVPIFANPDLSDFKLKPYVSHTTPKNPLRAAKQTKA